MYRYWTGTEKDEQINRDRQTSSEKRSGVNMLFKMLLKATVQVYVDKDLDMKRGAVNAGVLLPTILWSRMSEFNTYFSLAQQ